MHIFSHTLKYRNVTVKTVRWRFGTLFFSSKIDKIAIFSKVRGFLWAKHINPMSQDGYKKNGINGEFETFFDPAKLFRRLVWPGCPKTQPFFMVKRLKKMSGAHTLRSLIF